MKDDIFRLLFWIALIAITSTAAYLVASGVIFVVDRIIKFIVGML